MYVFYKLFLLLFFYEIDLNMYNEYNTRMYAVFRFGLFIGTGKILHMSFLWFLEAHFCYWGFTALLWFL